MDEVGVGEHAAEPAVPQQGQRADFVSPARISVSSGPIVTGSAVIARATVSWRTQAGTPWGSPTPHCGQRCSMRSSARGGYRTPGVASGSGVGVGVGVGYDIVGAGVAGGTGGGSSSSASAGSGGGSVPSPAASVWM